MGESWHQRCSTISVGARFREKKNISAVSRNRSAPVPEKRCDPQKQMPYSIHAKPTTCVYYLSVSLCSFRSGSPPASSDPPPSWGRRQEQSLRRGRGLKKKILIQFFEPYIHSQNSLVIFTVKIIITCSEAVYFDHFWAPPGAGYASSSRAIWSSSRTDSVEWVRSLDEWGAARWKITTHMRARGVYMVQYTKKTEERRNIKSGHRNPQPHDAVQ